jgi:hypothetical protein
LGPNQCVPAKDRAIAELSDLLTFCGLNKGRVHFVVVLNLTRRARDRYDHFVLRSHLQSLGISLRSATEPIHDTSTRNLMEGVLAAFAQFDNDVRSDRTRAGMKAAKEQLLKSVRNWGLTNRRGKPITSQAIGVLLRNQSCAEIVDLPEYGVRGKRGDAAQPERIVLHSPNHLFWQARFSRDDRWISFAAQSTCQP